MKTSTWFTFGAAATTAAALLLLPGCVSGPDYQRPALDTPESFRASTNAPPGTNSFAQLDWKSVYDDEQLRAYITMALTNNWDVKIAAARILQAEAAAGIARSEYYPTVSAGGDVYSTRASELGPSPIPSGIDPEAEYGDVFIGVPSYELDLWGRVRRANEAARARLLASEDAQRTVRQTLVAEVATTYLRLLEYDLELQIAQASLSVRTNSLALTTAREEGGLASMQDVYQSKVLVATAEAAIASALRQVEQTENELNFLLGRNPQPVVRGIPLVDHKLRAEVPAGLPSALLERRPDIRAAEQELIAANADIGQAKAAYYPKISLTGVFGFQTTEFSDLFDSAARAWQFGPAVSAPLFTGGRTRSEVRFAEAKFQESLAVYQRTVQRAFREVSDALTDYQRFQEIRARQQDLAQANRDAAAMAAVRYDGGVTSYLEVLYNEQQLFDAELQLAQARRNELLSVVALYRALGGGW